MMNRSEKRQGREPKGSRTKRAEKAVTLERAGSHGSLGNRRRKLRVAAGGTVVCACVVAVAAVFAVMGVHNRSAVEAGNTVTRGVADSINDLPDTKREGSSAALGTAENPFLLLEVVPYEEYAQMGYQISGCEPINIESGKYVTNSMGSILSSIGVTTGRVTNATLYYFDDEPEYENLCSQFTPRTIGWDYSQAGYYERVEKGEGNFEIDDNGYISKAEGGDVIWHSLNSAIESFDDSEINSSDYTYDWSNSANTKHQVNLGSSVGSRYYTYRHSSFSGYPDAGNLYVTYNVDLYENNDYFLRNTLGVAEEDLDDYCIVVKTITPAEINANSKTAVEWVNCADLITFSTYVQHGDSLISWWNDYRKLTSHTPTLTAGSNGSYATSASFSGDFDIPWEVAEAIFYRVTDPGDSYAAIAMNEGILEIGNYTADGEYKANVTRTIYDWSLRKSTYTYTDTGVNNNVYKLCVMLFGMDYSIVRSLYMEDNKTIVDGSDLLQEGTDAEKYWDIFQLCLTDANGDIPGGNPYSYWTTTDAWFMNGTSNVLGGSHTWVKGHVYMYNNNDQFTEQFMSDGTSVNGSIDSNGNLVTNGYFEEYEEYLKENGKTGTVADALRYILGLDKDSSADDKAVLRILDIEPCVTRPMSAALEKDADGNVTGTTRDEVLSDSFSLRESNILLMLPNYTGQIEINHMTTAEFNASTEDLNSEYDMIYLGLDCDSYNTDSITVKLKSADGTETSKTKELPVWNDSAMYKNTDNASNNKALVYFHTGDSMVSSEASNSSGFSRSVKYLFSTVTDALVEDTTLRFPGNDITTIKEEELKSFANTGKPIVAETYLYNTEACLIDQNSNICDLVNDLKGSNGSGIYEVNNDGKKILAAIESYTPTADFSQLPAIYDGTAGKDGTVTSPNYLSRNSDGGVLLPFTFTVNDSSGAEYSYRLYVDQNGDSKFSSDEVVYDYAGSFAGGSEQSFTYTLSSMWMGVVNWQLEIYNKDNADIHFRETGVSAAKNTSGTKKQIKVLQIMPSVDTVNVNLATDANFTKYYDKLEDYEINVDAIYLEDFEKYFEDNNSASDGGVFTFDSSKDIDLTIEEDDKTGQTLITGNNPVNYSTDLYEIFDNYNMLIFGFGDTYGSTNISNAYGAVDFIKYWVAEDKSILFTHDMTSFYNVDENAPGYTMNTLMRDVMGMNRYEGVSTYSGEKKSEIINYQSAGSYDTVHEADSTTELEQKQGYTYYAMKRLHQGGTDNESSMPYKYMIENFYATGNDDAMVSDEDNGFNSNGDLSTVVGQQNTGQITQYPYKIDEIFEVADTHGQYYELNMEDPEVTVWYSLLYDGVSPTSTSGNTGSAITYGVSPYDGANNYYIYSKGNVFYSGVGHSQVTGDMEIELFINTMVAAYRASYDAPIVEITGPESVSLENVNADYSSLEYALSIAQEFDAAESTDGTNRMDAEDISDGFTVEYNEDLGEDVIKITFMPEEPDAVTSNLDIWLWYEDTKGNITTVDDIYNASTNTKVSASGTQTVDGTSVNLFTDVTNMQEYYFYYPAKYVSDFKEGSSTQAARNTVHFGICREKLDENAEAALGSKVADYYQEGKTVLDLKVQTLFQLD